MNFFFTNPEFGLECSQLISESCACPQSVMPLVLKELASSEATNRRNAAFCVGELCKNAVDSTLRYPLEFLFH